MSLYDDLAVPYDATPAQIKASWRSLAAKLHPDREGGNAEAFARASRAWEILGDEAKRARYDETGDAVQAEPQAFKIVAERFLKILENCSIDFADPVKSTISDIEAEISNGRGVIAKMQKQNEKRRKALGRISAKGTNVLETIIEGTIGQTERDIARIEGLIVDFENAQKILEGHEYARPGQETPSAGLEQLKQLSQLLNG